MKTIISIISFFITLGFIANVTFADDFNTNDIFSDHSIEENIYNNVTDFENVIDKLIKSSPDALVMYSDDETIATIDNEGNVTGKGIGTTTVHVYYEKASEGGKIASCTVNVSGTTVHLDANNGALKTGSVTVLCGYPYGELPIPSRAGYSFDGWYTDNNENVTAETIVPTYNDHTLVAKWNALPSQEPVTKTGEYNLDVILNKKGSVNIDDIRAIKGSKDKWTVTFSEGKIASINKTGKISGLQTGNTTAIVTRGSDTFTINITVTEPAFEFKKLYINTGDNADASLKNTLLKPVYEVTNTKIATISDDGVITAHSYGSTKITAKLLGVKYSLSVIVDNPILKSNDISILNNVTFKQTILKSHSTNIIWSSDDPEIASVTNKGVIVPQKTGKTNIHVNVNGRDLVCHVKVDKPVISENVHTLQTGETFDLSLKETEYTPIWKSSNAKVATVDNNGHVVALKHGITTISTKINKVTFKCKVTVQ